MPPTYLSPASPVQTLSPWYQQQQEFCQNRTHHGRLFGPHLLLFSPPHTLMGLIYPVLWHPYNHITTGWYSTCSFDISPKLQSNCTNMGKMLGLNSRDISSWPLLYGGAMALLLRKTDYNTICIIGCWWSDKMLLYLHTTSRPLMWCYASTIVTAGGKTLITAVKSITSFYWSWGPQFGYSAGRWVGQD